MALNTGALNTGALNADSGPPPTLTEVFNTHTALWNSIPFAFQEHSTSWQSPLIATHECTWTTAISKVHEVLYGHSDVFAHTVSYESETSRVSSTHDSLWRMSALQAHDSLYQSSSASTTEGWAIHESLYQSSGGFNTLYNVHESIYQSSGSLSAIYQTHESLYQSSGSLSSISNTHETTWDSWIRIPGYAVHEVTWGSAGATTLVLSTHDHSWASQGSTASATSAVHTSSWSSIPRITVVSESTYQSVVESGSSHATTWRSFVQENVGTHETRYYSYIPDPQFVLANAYIEPDIQILSGSVTADEDSAYYQCEIELRDAKDYGLFVRDQAFVLHVLNDEYHFVVDSKGLTRSMDDDGNYQEVATISGLSPLCLQAAPRSTTITQTWTVPTMASVIVQELIGAVTWNLVDWMIPGFRLSVDNADPFEIAQNIVSAAGGLIESAPDGSVIVRHRWPTSIAELSLGVPSAILSETDIYSIQEQPTQDVLMNRIRIVDSNAGYQDRLEYEPYRLANGDTDPFNGTMYAYPSPWRNGLRIVTTRGSKIQIGLQSESVKTIYDQDEENTAETITFESGQSSVQYPIMTLDTFEWLDEDLGGLTFTPYATTLEASDSGTYYGYSLAKITYTSRRLQVPVRCTPTDNNPVEAQFLLLETQ